MVSTASMPTTTSSSYLQPLLELASRKLRTEASRGAPHYRQFLGHIAVYDFARQAYYSGLSFSQTTSTTPPSQTQSTQTPPPSIPDRSPKRSEAPTVPSFQTFSDALAQQIATMEEVVKTARALTVCTYETEDDEEDAEYEDMSGYDSYDVSEYHLDYPLDSEDPFDDTHIFGPLDEELEAVTVAYKRCEAQVEAEDEDDEDDSSQTECGSDVSSLTDVEDYDDYTSDKAEISPIERGLPLHEQQNALDQLLCHVKSSSSTSKSEQDVTRKCQFVPIRRCGSAREGAVGNVPVVRMVHF